jgi:hypothetical protein
MASRPANAGSGGTGSGRALTPMGDIAPPPDAAAPRSPAGHRATGPRPVRARDRGEPAVTGLVAWVPYLIVLAGAGAGLFVTAQSSAYAGRGTGLLGGSLLVAALARLLLPNRLAGLLASRRKASDVLAFAVFGAAVLAVALSLP